MVKKILSLVWISILLLSFSPDSKAELNYFSGKFNLQWEDSISIYNHDTETKDILSGNDFENSYLDLYIKNKDLSNKTINFSFTLYPKGRQKLEFLAARKFIRSWADSIFLSYDSANILDGITSNQETQINKQNGSIQLHHKGGFFIKLANDQVLDIFRRGGEGFLIEATNIEENFVNYRPANIFEIGWSLLQLDISLVVENANELESAFGGIKYDSANILIPDQIISYRNARLTAACYSANACNGQADKFIWAYGDNADTSSSAQTHANRAIFGGVDNTTDLVQQAILYFEDATTTLRDAFLNATTTTDTNRTLQTAYNEGKAAWEGVIALLDNTTDICHFSLVDASSTTTNCNDSRYGNSQRLLNQRSEEDAAYRLYRTARNYKAEYYDIYLAARNDVLSAASLLTLDATASASYQNGLNSLNRILANSLLAESGNADFNGYTQALASTSVQNFYNSIAVHDEADLLNETLNNLKSTNNNLAFKLQWGRNKLSLGLLAAVGKSKAEEQGYEANMAMAGLGVWYLVGKRLGFFINGFQNQIQTDFQYPSSDFFAKNERIKNGFDYGLDFLFGESSTISFALASGSTVLKTSSNSANTQLKNDYNIFEIGCQTKLLNANLKIGYANIIEKGKSDEGFSFTSLVDVNKPLPTKKLANGETLNTTQVQISLEQSF